MHNVSGVTGAGPLFRDVMLLLEGPEAGPSFPEPSGLVRAEICPVSGELPSAACPATITELFAAGTVPRTKCRLAPSPRLRSRPRLRVVGRSSDPLQIVFPGTATFLKSIPFFGRSIRP